MEIRELLVSADALIRVVVFLLYAPICLIALRWLLPGLSPTARLLALVMLAAQILLLAAGLENIPRWDTRGWLLSLDQEWNFPSTFASAQLAVVGGAALLTALLTPRRQNLYRLNLVVIGVLFLLFAWDEYFYLHEDNMPLKIAYVTVGALIAAASAKLALARPGRARLWQISLMAGMALYVFGAVLLEPYHESDLRLVFLEIEGSVRVYNLEEALEYLGVWLVLVAVLGKLSAAKGRLSLFAQLFLFLWPVLWTALLIQNAWLPRVELRFRARPAAVEFASGTRLLGYRLERDKEAIVLWLYPSAWRSHYRETGFSVHLIDQASGQSVASRHVHTDLQFYLMQIPGFTHIYRQKIVLEIPPDTPTNRAYWLTLAIWRDRGDEFIVQKVHSSDHKLLGDEQIIFDEFVLRAEDAVPSTAPLAVFENGITLSAAELPERASGGGALPIRFTWTAAGALSESYVQFLHLGHQASGEWQVYDQQPLGARLPTRLWYEGLTDSEMWQVWLPADLAPGLYQVFTGLYRLHDQERLAATDSYGEPYVDARVPLGDLLIEDS